MYRLDPNPWLFFRAWNTDQSPKNDWAFNTAGNALSLVRKNAAPSALTLSAAANATDWAPGKVWQVSGNLYRVGISTASISGITGLIGLAGVFTGGTLDGVFEDVSAYDPSTNPLSSLGTNAPADWVNGAAIASGALANAKFAADVLLNANVTQIVGDDEQIAGFNNALEEGFQVRTISPGAINAAAFATGVLPANFASQVIDSAGRVTLNMTQMTELLSDDDIGTIATAIIASFNESSDVPIITQATATVDRLKADAMFLELVADALAAKTAAEANSAEIAKVPKQNENRTWTIGGGDPSVIRIGEAE